MKQIMTDIHQHLLWGVDDGARTPKLMETMLRQASEQGIRKVVATPHAVPGFEPFDVGLCRERQMEAQHFCKVSGLDIKVILGAEIAWTDQAVLSLRQSRIPTLGDSDYVLLELWREVSWSVAVDAVRQLIGAGYCPILAHPERYVTFLLSPRKAIRFREETGDFLQCRFIRTLIDKRAVDVVASDAHGSKARPVNLAAAWKWLAVNTDETYAAQVTNFDGV